MILCQESLWYYIKVYIRLCIESMGPVGFAIGVLVTIFVMYWMFFGEYPLLLGKGSYQREEHDDCKERD